MGSVAATARGGRAAARRRATACSPPPLSSVNALPPFTPHTCQHLPRCVGVAVHRLLAQQHEARRLAARDRHQQPRHRQRLQLAVVDQALAQHQLSGIFWDDDPEGFVRLLEIGMGATAERAGDTITLRRK